jgi:uncharacterized protein
MAEALRVDVVFAGAARVCRRSVRVEPGASVADAIQASGIADEIGSAGIDYSRVGVFGRAVSPATPLRDGDRIEIYRPLKIDPKEARRRRARK